MMNTKSQAMQRRQVILDALADGPYSLTALARRLGLPKQSIANNVDVLVASGRIDRVVVPCGMTRVAIVGLPGFDPDDAELVDGDPGSDRPIFAEIVRARFAAVPEENHDAALLRHLVLAWGSVAV
jgi:hypothetical protein